MAETVLAIDFGTTNSLVGAIHQGRRIEALPLDMASPDPTLMRTLLFFPHDDVCFYGAEAISQYLEHEMEGRLFRSFKTHLPNQNYLGTMVDKRVMSLENMVGLFLLELKKRSEKILGTTVTKAVLGRPARYSMDEVSDTFAVHRMRKAAEFAGFKEIQFVPEPLAAAFDYRRQIKDEKLVLIGDFGGGTSDFTLIRLRPNQFSKEDVLAIDGTPLAGDALDSLFMSHKLNELFGSKCKYRLPFSSNILTMPPAIMQRLNQPAHIVHLRDKETYEFIREIRKSSLSDKDKEAIDRLVVLIEDQQIFPFFENIEKVKRDLSIHEEAFFSFDYPGIEVSQKFSATQFFEWAEVTREKIFESLDRCLVSAGVGPEQVNLVCLTGGTAKVPFIRRELEKRFGVDRLQTQSHFHSVLSGLTESAQFWLSGNSVV